MNNCIVTRIQQIYNSLNIHKAIFVYNHNYNLSLYNLLNVNLFPIGMINNMQHVIWFINNKKRILLIDSIDLENIDLLAKDYAIDLTEVNLIIFIRPLKKFTVKKNMFSPNLNIKYV